MALAVAQPGELGPGRELAIEQHVDRRDRRRAHGIERVGREVVVEQEPPEAAVVGLADPACLADMRASDTKLKELLVKLLR